MNNKIYFLFFILFLRIYYDLVVNQMPTQQHFINNVFFFFREKSKGKIVVLYFLKPA